MTRLQRQDNLNSVLACYWVILNVLISLYCGVFLFKNIYYVHRLTNFKHFWHSETVLLNKYKLRVQRNISDYRSQLSYVIDQIIECCKGLF